MEDDIQSLEFVFENCEMMEFTKDDIQNMELKGISTQILKVVGNGIAKRFSIDEVFIEIKKEANGSHSFFESINTTKFARLLQYKDITIIDFHFRDGKAESYYVLYNGEERNSYQKTFYNELGNLVIDIRKR